MSTIRSPSFLVRDKAWKHILLRCTHLLNFLANTWRNYPAVTNEGRRHPSTLCCKIAIGLSVLILKFSRIRLDSLNPSSSPSNNCENITQSSKMSSPRFACPPSWPPLYFSSQHYLYVLIYNKPGHFHGHHLFPKRDTLIMLIMVGDGIIVRIYACYDDLIDVVYFNPIGHKSNLGGGMRSLP